MQQSAALAYQQTTNQTASPRDLEAQLLSKSAANIQRIRDNWDEAQDQLLDALDYNRKLWAVLIDTVTKDDNPLPKEIRQNVANLGIFVLGQTVELQASPQVEKLDVLININREISAGLRNTPISE